MDSMKLISYLVMTNAVRTAKQIYFGVGLLCAPRPV